MLYRFDEIDDRLHLLPIAARRALDACGRRLSREGWQSLPLSERQRIVELGSATTVDVAAVLSVTARAVPEAGVTEPTAEPPAAAVPASVREALGPARPIPDPVWAALSPLDRYCLHKVASRGREERLAAAYAEIIGYSALSSHLAPSGGVRMVNVGEKAVTARTAVGESTVTMSEEAFERLKAHTVPKGDVLGTARLAGIMAAKRTSDLIPLCHPLSLSRVEVALSLLDAERAVHIVATVDAVDRTGVEMEALTAASVAALTVYDMLKGIDRAMVIGPTRLVSKTGGRTGDFHR